LSPTEALEERIARLDALIAERADGHRGLGLRLALGMALELKRGLPPGAETGALMESWQERYPEEWVEEAISQAGVLLRNPAKMTAELESRLKEKGLIPPEDADISPVE
jgi:hypothetical protein